MHDMNSKISPKERLSLVGMYLRLPFSLLASIALSPFLARTRGKGINRVIAEAVASFFITHCSPRQLQHFLGPSTEKYIQWAKKRSLQPIVEDLSGSETAKLMWLTEKRTDRVLFYIHGGGYMSPHTDNMVGFCPGLRKALLQETGGELDFGIASLVYTLHPATFPTQLTEFILALTHLISSGVSPENIILIGDSAGANLIIQFITHTLRPVPDVILSPFRAIEGIDVPRRLLRGIILVSPWISLGTPTPSYARNTKYDFVNASAFTRWGSWYMERVQPLHIPWIKPSSSSTFKGLETMVSRVLITAGGRECILDDATSIFDMIEELQIPKENLTVTLDIEEKGIHEDSILDIESPQKSDGGFSDATMRQVNWIREAFEA
ncbi:Alpha/Beta hydrolase protein [Lentinula edodes]|nr:Alpha/Beta hydrolase protein [Lentinula edodes]